MDREGFGVNPCNGGGYGVLGRITEGAFAIPDRDTRETLRTEIMGVAKDSNFLETARFETGEIDKATPGSANWWFYHLLQQAEIVGSTRGGAAGHLKLAGEQDHKLRIAIKPQGSYLWFSRSTIIKHELGHFVREAQVMTHRRSRGWFRESRSLFEQERRRCCYLYNLFWVLIREEWLVWWFTMPNWRWRFGMVVAAAVLIGGVTLFVAYWIIGLELSVALIGAFALGAVLSLLVWCFTLLAWRR